MAVERSSTRDRNSWPVLVGLALVAVGAGTAAYLRWPGSVSISTTVATATRSMRGAVETPSIASSGPVIAPQNMPTPAAPDPIAPTFDIVRVSPQGSAVVAGRAEPFAHVVIRDGGRILGEATADRNGEFVIVPDDKVTTGGRELTLTARGADGREISGLDSVVVMVGAPPSEPPRTTTEAQPVAPATADARPFAPPTTDAQPVAPVIAEVKPAEPIVAAIDTPVAVLLPRDGSAPRILQGPAKPQGLALNTVDYDQQGDIRFSGSAKPSAPVRVYVDNKPVGEASTDPAGQWTLTPPDAVQPGVHQLRVDEIASTGQVQHRVELPFQRTATPISGLSPGQMVVQPGSNLWRIARQSYGSGARYTVIFLANREHIRDPNRIYPGQIFSIPGEQAAQTR